jgi:hypothetical protein
MHHCVILFIVKCNGFLLMSSTDMYDDVLPPKLIDTSAIHYLDGALKKSHEIRIKYHRIIWNFGIVFVFVFIVGAVLYYRYINRPTPEEADYKLIKDQEYVLSKIRYFQEQNRRINESSRVSPGSEISGLPVTHPPLDF